MSAAKKFSLLAHLSKTHKKTKETILLCKDLKEGMLISLSNDNFCAWFNDHSHERLKEKWGDEIPKRMRVGSKVLSLFSSGKVFTSKDTVVYVGKKMLTFCDKEGTVKTRQIRLVLGNGEVGFLEGYDVKHFEPLKDSCKSESSSQ